MLNIEAETAMIAALQRIARKPWPSEHKRVREFYDPLQGKYVTIEVGETEEWNRPDWRPYWTDKPELNSCDCPKCIVIRTLADVKEASRVDTNVG